MIDFMTYRVIDSNLISTFGYISKELFEKIGAGKGFNML